MQCFCYREEEKIFTTYEDNFQDGYALTTINMTSQVTCSLPPLIGDAVYGFVVKMETFDLAARVWFQNVPLNEYKCAHTLCFWLKKTMPHSHHCYIKSPGVNEQYAHWGRAVDKRLSVISSEAGSPVNILR